MTPYLSIEEVVADIAPLQRLRVVGVDAAHHRRGLRGRVAVAARGVMDEGHLDRSVGRRSGPPGLVGAPLGPGHDGWLRRHGRGRRRELETCDRGRGTPDDADEHGGAVGVLRAVDRDHADVAQAFRRGPGPCLPRPHLEVASRARPDGLGEGPLLPAFFRDALQRDVVPALQVCPSSLVRSSTSTSPVRAGGAHDDAGHGEAHAGVHGDRSHGHVGGGGASTAPSAGAAPRPVVAAAGGPTGSAARRLAVRNSTGGVLIHVSTAALTRGAVQTAAIAPRTERMVIAARRAARLWG